MCIGDLYRKALKKLLVNGVEKSLFLGEIVDGLSGAFDRRVEGVQTVQKIVAAKRLLCERVYHVLNLVGDEIAAGEVGVIENGAEDALGQEVLDQHLLNRGFGEIRID